MSVVLSRYSGILHVAILLSTLLEPGGSSWAEPGEKDKPGNSVNQLLLADQISDYPASDAEDVAMGEKSLPGPSLEGWEPRPSVRSYVSVLALSGGFTRWAVAREFESKIYGAYGKHAWFRGYIRGGQKIPVRYKARGGGCKKGTWYGDSSGRYICSTDGFEVTLKPPHPSSVTAPRLNRPLPYHYVKVRPGGPRLHYNSVPTLKEDAQIKAALKGEGSFPDAVDRQVEGAFFVAVDRTITAEGGRYLRTVRQHYVKEDET